MLAPISITPVLVLNCDQEFETNEVQLHEHIEKVKAFITSTQNSFTPAKADWQMLRRVTAVVDDELQNV